MRWFFSVRVQLAVALALCGVVAAAIWALLLGRQNDWRHLVGAWLFAANLVAFAIYGLDKYLAGRYMGIFRVAELVLHTLAGVGGSPAALVAMLLFRHKTIKASFRLVFWCIVFVQIALTAYIVKLLWWT